MLKMTKGSMNQITVRKKPMMESIIMKPPKTSILPLLP